MDASKLLTAINFAARKHRDQRRKGPAADPYINHPIEVAHLLSNVGGVTETDVLIAAVLHDTVEDTDTTAAELTELFGSHVSDMVLEVTDDKSLPKAQRKQLQIDHGPHLSAGAKQIKLCDKISNVRDVLQSPPQDWSQQRRDDYVVWATRVVDTVRGVNPALESYFDQISKGR
jgi:GTP diphosphokinase / guanosine-3',5'-bis(diphosphate) 3'-diphosphatase